MEKIHWYRFFNNTNQDKNKVITRNETVIDNNIIIARICNGNTLFAKFTNLNQFILFFESLPINEKTFYAVLQYKTRYLYLDVDYNLINKMTTHEKKQLINLITSYLNEFIAKHGYKFGISKHFNKYFIWDATRSNKFSIHIINPQIIMYYKDIQHFVQAFHYWLHYNNKIHHECKIDDNIYHDGYQLWKLNNNHNGKKNSMLRLYSPKHVNLKFQFEINFMNNLKNCNKSFISSNFKLPINSIIRVIKSTNNNKKVKKKEKKIIISKNKNIKTHININDFCNRNILCKISNIFKTKNIKYNTNSQHKNDTIYLNEIDWRLSDHVCPVAHRKHKSNEAYITIQCINETDIHFCKYRCLDNDCANDITCFFITLSNIYKRPWILTKIYNKLKNIHILKKIDVFINLLFKKNIIQYNNNQKQHQLIFHNDDKLRFDGRNKDFLFSTFFYSNIIHVECGINNISFFYYQNTPVLNCWYCKKKIKLHENNNLSKYFV